MFAANLRRALDTLGGTLPQVLLVGGPAGDDELLGVLLRALPGDVPVGRASVGATLAGRRRAIATPPRWAWRWPRAPRETAAHNRLLYLCIYSTLPCSAAGRR